MHDDLIAELCAALPGLTSDQAARALAALGGALSTSTASAGAARYLDCVAVLDAAHDVACALALAEVNAGAVDAGTPPAHAS